MHWCVSNFIYLFFENSQATLSIYLHIILKYENVLQTQD